MKIKLYKKIIKKRFQTKIYILKITEKKFWSFIRKNKRNKK